MASKSINLICNYYRIHLEDDDLVKSLHQYEIEIKLSEAALGGGEQPPLSLIAQMNDPKKVPTELRKRIVAAALERWLDSENSDQKDRFVKCDLDCRTVIANVDLERLVDHASLDVPYRHGNLRLSTLIFSVQLNKTKLDYLTILNIAIGPDGRTSPRLVEQSATGTTTYSAENRIKSCCNTQLLRGLIIQMKSLVFGQALSVCNTAGWFYEPLRQAQDIDDCQLCIYPALRNSRSVSTEFVSSLNGALAGRQAGTSHIKVFDLPIRSQISEISGSADASIGLHDQTSIRAYFKKHYGIGICRPDWPCAEFDLGGEQHKVPIELCLLLPAEKVPDQRALSTGESPLDPLDYFKQVERHAKFVADSNESNLKKIGISIDSTPIKVTGQFLNPVWLIGKNHSNGPVTIEPKNGQYDASAARFWRPVKLGKFSITLIDTSAYFLTEYNKLRGFVGEYCRVGQAQGVEISNYRTPIDIIIQEDEKSLRGRLRKHIEELNEQCFDHSIVVLSKDRHHFGSYVHFLETQLGHSTGRRTRLSVLQLVNLEQSLDKAKNKDDSQLRNLWLKYNSQLGGLNYVLSLHAEQLPGDNFLVFGVDVRHPGRGEEFSVASVIGLWAINSEGCSHSTRLRARLTRHGDESSIEHTNDVCLMIEQILSSYHTRMKGSLPSEILILLKETWNEKFKMDEAKGLGEILEVISKSYALIGQAVPSVACFEIQQHHDVRFKSSSLEDSPALPSGTIIVDSNLIGHDAFAFYAAPRSDLSGHVEPPIARKLKDGIPSMTNIKYQQLLLTLCYLSPSTKCTALPAPIDLAENATKRAKEIALVWKDECFTSGDWIEQLNAYFTDLTSRSDYGDTLFYV